MRYIFGDYTLDDERRELWCREQAVSLRPKVFDLLVTLIRQRDRTVSKQELQCQLWPNLYVSPATLSGCIKLARQAVGDRGTTQNSIQTLHGRGYRFVASVEEQAQRPPVATPQQVPPSPSAPAETTAAVDLSCPVLHTADGEYKLVTVLCCGHADTPAVAARRELERMYRLMQVAFGLAREVIGYYAGTIIYHTHQGFTAVFGAPVAQEDHAHRAVLAACELYRRLCTSLALHEPTVGDAFSVGMGLHSGMVVVGSLGSAPQQLYTAVGEPTHLAMRLQQAAPPGTILMSAATYRLVHEEVQVTACQPVDRGGQATPMPVYVLQGLLPPHPGMLGHHARPWSPFVGRRLELASLDALLQRVEMGQGQVVSVVGEPGMGKTRLMHEFAQRLVPTRVTYLTGRCRATGQTTPYLPIRELLQNACGFTERVPHAVMTAQVHKQLQGLGIASTEAAPYLLHMLGVPDAVDLLVDLSPQTIRLRTFAALHTLFLRHSQRQPLVLVVENLHRSDPTSQEYVTDLVERLAGVRLLLLVTCRPGYRPPWLDKSYATQLTLARLGPEDSRRVVQAAMHPAPCAEPVLQAIVAKAAGNPLFLEELAWGVREQGTLPEEVPATVQAMLAARMDRLPAEAKMLLQIAAVIGMEVPLALLQAIAEEPEEALQQSLQYLRATEFLYETQVVPELTYTFKHALTHEVAYNSLLQERRRVLHAQSVEALEGLAGDRGAEQIERLAHHAVQGERWDKALAYCRQAGEKALARSAYREAITHLEQALGALQHLCESRAMGEQAIDLRLDLCFTLWRLGDWRGALDRLREAEALAEHLGDQHRLAHVLSEMADSLRILGDSERALMAGQRALSLAIALGDTALQVDANMQMGLICYHRGDYGQAIEALRKTVTARACHSHHKHDARHVDMVVWPWSWLLVSLSQVGAFAEGCAMRAEVLRLAEATAYPFCLAVATFGVGRLFLRQGNLLQAIAILERGLAVCQTHDLQDWLPELAASVGYAYALAGRLPEALPLLEQAAGQYATMRGGALDPTTVIWLGEAYLRAGRLDEAGSQAQNALAYSRAHQERGDAAYALQLLGEIAVQRQPPECNQAGEYYRQALALAEELGMRPLQAHCHRGLGMLYSATGQLEQARTELSSAIALYRAMEMTFWLSQAEVALTHVER
jgi:class 3 adenylate cyclase/tetratricopeptide (TPR) repeat protein